MSRWITFFTLLTALWTPATLASITITFYPDQSGGTMADFAGSGTNLNPGGGNATSWSNLNGGDPFDASLNSAQFPLAMALQLSESVNVIALDFDSDGVGDNQDDFTVRFDSIFSFEDVYNITGTTQVIGLDFSLLNPGVYTRSANTLGELTLVIAGSPPVDSDNDGVSDAADNCSETSNPEQRDTDGDNIGNACDADFNQDCTVNFLDLSIFGGNFLVSGDLDTDLNGDGLTNFADLSILSQRFFMPPGPSGLSNDCE